MSDEQKAPEIALHFRGDGETRIPGIPLRDLTKADVAELRPEALREALAARHGDGPLYEPAAKVRLPINRSSIDAAVPPTDETPAAGTTGDGQGEPAGGDS